MRLRAPARVWLPVWAGVWLLALAGCTGMAPPRERPAIIDTGDDDGQYRRQVIKQEIELDRERQRQIERDILRDVPHQERK